MFCLSRKSKQGKILEKFHLENSKFTDWPAININTKLIRINDAVFSVKFLLT